MFASREVTFQPKKMDSGDDQVRILPVGRTKAHRAEILCCAYLPPDINPIKYPNGVLVTAGNDLTIKKWQVSDRQELELAGHFECTLEDGFTSSTVCHMDSISSMAVDANFLFTASDDCSIRIWDVPGNFLVRSLTEKDGGHSEPIKRLLIIPSEGFLVSLSIDQQIKVRPLLFSPASFCIPASAS
jgi:WD40 repeat protein